MSDIDFDLNGREAFGSFELAQTFRRSIEDENVVSRLIRAATEFTAALYEANGKAFTPNFVLHIQQENTLKVSITNNPVAANKYLQAVFNKGTLVCVEEVKRLSI